jgi:hypothetical protein
MAMATHLSWMAALTGDDYYYLDAFINSDVGADQIVTSPPRGIFLLFRYSDGLFRPSE